MASYSWKSGTSGGDWNQPAQWSGDVVPAVTDQASVAGASGTITATAASFGTVGFASPNATLQWLPDAGFTLATLAGTFTLSGGTITLGNDAFNQGDAGQGSFNVAGSGTLVDNGTVELDQAQLNDFTDGQTVAFTPSVQINASFTAANGTTMAFRNAVQVGTAGTLDLEGDGSAGGMIAQGQVSNAGSLIVNNAATAEIAALLSNAVTGQITVENGATLQVDAKAQLSNAGTITLTQGSTLWLNSALSAASGTIAFGDGSDNELVVNPGSSYPVLAATIANFGGNDTIDLAGFAYSGSATLSQNGGMLQVSNGSHIIARLTMANLSSIFGELTLSDDGSGNFSNGNGGIDLSVTPPDPPRSLALAAASDTGTRGDDITTVTTPVIAGIGTPGDTVSLLDAGKPVGTAVVGADSTWSITTSVLNLGTHTLTATETTATGTASGASLPLVLQIVAVPAAPGALALSSATSGPGVSAVTDPVVTGTGTAGDSVTLLDGTTRVGTGTVAANGTWSVTSAVLSTGTHSLTAIEADAAGDPSPASAPLPVTIPAGAAGPPVSSLAAVDAAIQGVLRTTPAATYAAQEAAQIDAGSLGLTQFVAQLIAQAANTTAAALVTYDKFYGTIPGSAGLDYLSGFAAGLPAQGFSPQNVWVNLGASFAANGSFGATYGAMTRDQFVTSVYNSIFNQAQDAAGHAALVQSLDFYAGYAGSELGARGALEGILLYLSYGTAGSTLATAANAFLSAAASGTATYHGELIAQYGHVG